MALPRITVVLACFDRHLDHLESSLCSVLDQDYPNLELIVIDGSQADHTTATLRHYRDDIDLWIRQKCSTLAQTINLGLSRATGDIVAVLQAGDLHLHGALDAVARAMAGKADWVVGRCQHINEYDQRLSLCQPDLPASLAAFLKHDSGVLPGRAMFWRRRITQQLGLMDESLSLCFEYDYQCRMLAAGHEPVILGHTVSAQRESQADHDAGATLEQGREQIQVALRHAHHLNPAELQSLLRNCDYRSRIYAMAEAEAQGDDSTLQTLRTLLRRPWHLMDEAIRQVIVHGSHSSAPSLPTTPRLKPAA